MLEKILNSIEITPKQIKIFVFAFVAVAVMVSLKQLGVHAPFSISFP
jgi:hypothetical protein